MARDDDRDLGKPPSEWAKEGGALLRELIEALTATSNYLASANRMLVSRQDIREAMQKSSAQLKRATEAARRLRDLLSR